MFTQEFSSQHLTRAPRLTTADLRDFSAELRRMERSGEITMSEYMSLTEDVAVIGKRTNS